MLLNAAQAAVVKSGLGGWLFYNVYHRDPVADLILEVPTGRMNSRPWVCLVCPNADPIKLVHRVEANVLDQVPGQQISYSTRNEFRQVLSGLAPGEPVAAQCSSALPRLSTLDLGAARLMQECGLDLVSSETIVQEVLGTLSTVQAASHDRSAIILLDVVDDVWKRLAVTFAGGQPLRERQVQDWITARFRQAGMATEEAPIVAFGRNSADPHYAPTDGGAQLRQGDVVQLDIWAREAASEGVYADISWIGIAAEKATSQQQEVFETVIGARDAAIALISTALAAGDGVTGADVDRHTREALRTAGMLRYTRHRTGHSIDRELHGYGVNLDCSEFPDERRLIDGSCFSVEPGLYLADFGMRTEVDVCVRSGQATVSGERRQTELLTTPATG